MMSEILVLLATGLVAMAGIWAMIQIGLMLT